MADTLLAATLLHTPAKPGAARPLVPDTGLPVNMTGSTQGSDIVGWANAASIRTAVKAELNEKTVYQDRALKDRAFKDIVPNSTIENFLKECDLYDSEKKRWTNIKHKPAKEAQLYDSLVDIFNAVIDHQPFGISQQRLAINSRSVSFPHAEGQIIKPSERVKPKGRSKKSAATHRGGPLSTSPDISIRAVVKDNVEKSNFPYVKDPKPSYKTIVSPIEVKLQKNMNLGSNMTQIANYARQIFRQQSNRFLVNSLLLSESHVKLLVFGRDGLHHSVNTNYHTNAVTFVRFILGVSSTKGKLAGYDESIYWKDGRRWIDTKDADNHDVTYAIVHDGPIFDTRTIRGRGTCCWLVETIEGAFLVIKDAWRSKSRQAEFAMMEKVKDLDGVGHMIAFQDRIAVLSNLRGLDLDTLALTEKNVMFRDRILSRLTLECHGRTITQFRSRTQLLHAYRDAIAGHQNLWNAGILHRDVSANNVLLGLDGCEKGNRGILIDLDMAVLLDRTKSLHGIDLRTGTRAFQSVNVLKGYEEGSTVRPHDFTDDLESFYYVLCWVCCGYSAPKTIAEPFPKVLAEWEDGDARRAYHAKNSLWADDFGFRAQGYFGEAFQKLLMVLHAFFVDLKQTQRHHAKENINPPTIEQMQAFADSTYATVLGHIDQAIANVKDGIEEVTNGEHDEQVKEEAQSKENSEHEEALDKGQDEDGAEFRDDADEDGEGGDHDAVEEVGDEASYDSEAEEVDERSYENEEAVGAKAGDYYEEDEDDEDDEHDPDYVDESEDEVGNDSDEMARADKMWGGSSALPTNTPIQSNFTLNTLPPLANHRSNLKRSSQGSDEEHVSKRARDRKFMNGPQTRSRLSQSSEPSTD